VSALVSSLVLVTGFALLLGFVLVSGRTLSRGGLFPSVTRADAPATYWREVILLTLLLVGSIIFVTGKASL
jgi:hypothetical protein